MIPYGLRLRKYPKKMNNFKAIDLFSGIGGQSQGLKDAGFKVVASVEINQDAIKSYKLNHPKTKIFNQDIRTININEVLAELDEENLDLLAGCPPCQGFSSIRRLNRQSSVRDDRNRLILEYLRFVKELRPKTIMLENVPGLVNYYLFKEMVKQIKDLGYFVNFEVVNVKDYGVPQRRKRLILVGSLLGQISVAKVDVPKYTVRDAIGSMKKIEESSDTAHKIVANHTQRIKHMITMIPKDGGSRKDLPSEYVLECHKKKNVGFNDVYGRLKWDDYSSTITGGCLNPSKGRFLHPEEDRCITAREAALLQTFPINYKFPEGVSKTAVALMIGNALPPKFSYFQSINIYNHLKEFYD